MKCHVVLWIPTLVYTGFDTPLITQVERNISDIPGNELFVKLELVNGTDFCVSTRNNDGTYSVFVELKRVSVSANGLIQYTYKSTSAKKNGFRFTSTEFPTAIYHLIKSFYHIHDFHDAEVDSTFRPFLAGGKVNIKKENNKAILHYLKMYGNFMSNSVSSLQYAIRAVRNNKKLVRPDTRGWIQELCLFAKGYEVYMGVLYGSKYNTICKTNSTNRAWRHVACNIENGMNYVRTVEHEYGEYNQQSFVEEVKNEALSSLESAKQSIDLAQKSINLGKKSIYLGWGSVILGGVSIFAAVISIVYASRIARSSSRELQEVAGALKQNIGTIPADISMINSNVDSLLIENQRSNEAMEDIVKRQWTIIHKLEDQGNEGEE